MLAVIYFQVIELSPSKWIEGIVIGNGFCSGRGYKCKIPARQNVFCGTGSIHMKIKSKPNKDSLSQDKIYWIILGCFCLILIVLHILAPIGMYDDAVFATEWRDENLFDTLVQRYQVWTSRIIIEPFMRSMSAYPYLWKILNVLVVLLFTWMVADLFGIWSGLKEKEGEERREAAAVFSILVWTVPIASLGRAGWATTTTVYLWVLTFGIAAMHPIKHWLCGEQCPKWELALCPFALLYAANMEQMAAVLLGVYLVFGIYIFMEKKRLPIFYCVMLFLLAASWVFMLTAPGNGVRNALETELFFPEYAKLRTSDKIIMGFLESAHYYLVAGCDEMTFLFGLLTGVLLLAFLTKSSKQKGFAIKMIPATIIAVFPFFFYWGIGVCGKLLVTMEKPWLKDTWMEYLLRGLWNHDLPLWGDFPWEWIPWQIATYLAVLVCVAFTIYVLHGNSKETWLQLLILGAGFASRMILGFSATIYRSGDRTALFASVAILIVVLRNLLIFRKNTEKVYLKILMAVYVAVCIAGNLW